MRTLILLISFATMASFASAQKIAAKELPAAVNTSFAKLYPSIKDAKWVKENANYEANFDLNKAETSATFDAAGNFLEEESEINPAALPQPALDYMKKTYPDKKIKEASKIKDAKGTQTFEAEAKGLEVIFDAAGTFLKAIIQAEKSKKD